MRVNLKEEKLLDMERPPINNQLQKLVQQIKELPPNSSEYCKALNELLRLITPQLIKLGSSYLNHYQDLHADALLETIKKLSKIIQKYDSSKGRTVLNWIKQAYKFELLDLKKAAARRKMKECSLNRDIPAASEEKTEDRGSYRKVVLEDPEGLLASIKLTYANQKTNLEESISLREILLMISNGKTRMDISREFHIPQGSLYSFIERNLSPLKDRDSKERKLKKQEIRDYFEKYSRQSDRQ